MVPEEAVPPKPATGEVAIFSITQATTATFNDLYFRLTFFFFIKAGSKRVLKSKQGELVGEEGDLLIFPPGSMVTMENRPVLDGDYRAVGISFSDEVINAAFGENGVAPSSREISNVRAETDDPAIVLKLAEDALKHTDLPDPILRHRLLEPLIWLRHRGIHLSAQTEELPLSRLRRLIETDLSYPWRIADVVDRFAMSEATLRRSLVKSGQGFSKTLLNTRLEHGLSRLQTSGAPVSEIALDCGFKTPSHFSDAFRKRFGISPKEIRTSSV